MDFEERPAKRKVRFHAPVEERTKKQELQKTGYVEVPEGIIDAAGLWAWVKDTRPDVGWFLVPDGWKEVGGSATRKALPNEFDFHFRGRPSASTITGTISSYYAIGPTRLEWVENLLSRLDCWREAKLNAANVIRPLPWPFFPTKDYASPDSSSASSSDFGLKVVDLEGNLTVQGIWGKESAVKILERESYKELWTTKVEPLFNQGRRVAVLVLGNPGTGKTAFLLYVFIILLRAKKKVLLRTKGGSLYYCSPDASGKYDSRQLASYAEIRLDTDPEIHFLADGRLPDVPVFVGKTLLACTPLKTNYKDFANDSACRSFYLPTWSCKELALLRQEVFPQTDLQAMKDRYVQWGGCPRYVLEMRSVDLMEVITKMAHMESVVAAAASGSAESNHPSHKVLYMRVLEDYQNYDLQYASPFVRKAVYEKLHRDQVNTLRAFLSSGGSVMQGFGSLKGGVLQEHFRTVATQTKSFRVREVFEELATPSPAPSMQAFLFGQPLNVWRVDDLASTVYDRIIWPENAIEETIDALIITKNSAGAVRLLCFQTSQISGHGLKYNGMLKLMNKFKVQADQAEVYIVTSNELFENAGWQNWRIKNNNLLKDNALLRQLQGIRQFALDSNA